MIEKTSMIKFLELRMKNIMQSQIKLLNVIQNGQPVLVGTTSIEKSEKISDFLNKKKIKHNVLNAKQHEKEAKIIAEAGKINAVTIATNMAGRGTDIKLGGNKNFNEDGKKNDLK